MFVYKYCSKCKKRNHKANGHCARCGDKLTTSEQFGKDVFAITLSIVIILSAGVAFASRSYFNHKANKIEQAKVETNSTEQLQNQQAPTTADQSTSTNTPSATTTPKTTAPATTNTTTNNTPSNNNAPTTTPAPITTPITTPATITGIKIIANNFIQIPACDFITPIGNPPPCNHYNPIPME
ncbi:MAG: hypothetical protein NTY30_00085 [Candidatus Berkelbacteria bacterium]|nr:hypothetical protein [Candidatus Berkelbacteria bacterium]